MPVSAALLVSGSPGGQDGAKGPGAPSPAFVRGEKGTSSVRLRKKKDESNQGGKKKNRHSGDFGFFSPKAADGRREQVQAHERNARKTDDLGDWNYITFPNGVPTVHELKTNINSANLPGVKEPLATPVKVTMREVPGMTPVKPRTNLNSCKAVSSSVMNVNRQSGDFTQMNLHQYPAGGRQEEPVRRRPHGRSQSQQPNRNSRVIEDSSHGSHPPAYLHVTPTRPCSQQPKRLTEAQTKRCSDEFEFKKVMYRSSGDFSQLQQVLSQELCKEEERHIVGKMISKELHGDTGSEGSEESGIFSTGSSQDSPRKEARKPGLGRRAITQLNIQQNPRKNSYNHALAKSQENLVKVSSDETADDVFETESTTLKKGLLWQQRDKLFSRWKERYFILTKDFLQCFKKETSKITEMGGFIFKIKLSEVENCELLDKRGYLTICLFIKEGKIYLRKTEGIREWYDLITDGMHESRSRRNKRSSAIFADRRQNTDSSSMENWLAQRKLGGKIGLSDSTPEVNKVGEKVSITLDELSNLYKNEEKEDEQRKQEEKNNDEKIRQKKKINRLSLMSDIELPDIAGGDLDIDFEKGIFLRRSKAGTDSGNNSMNTNKSNSSSGSSKLGAPIESSFMEEEEDQIQKSPSDAKPLNKNIIEVRYRERSGSDAHSRRSPGRQPNSNCDIKRRSHVNRLQITHV